MRKFAAARLLVLLVQIPSEAWMLSFVSVVCCQIEVSGTGRSLVQRSPTVCVCVCVYVYVIVINSNPVHLQ